MKGEAGMDCPDNCPTCDPTPEPSEVAETTAGKREAMCGCVVGGLHRYACAGVGHVDPPRTAEPDAGEVDDEAEVVARIVAIAFTENRDDSPFVRSRKTADALLASPWLAAHVSAAETKARADERERIAKAIESIPTYIATPARGGYSREGVSPESVRRRAASIARADAR